MTPDEAAQWEAARRHVLASVGEGMCPVHSVPLDPTAMLGAPVIGHCILCRKYWHADYSTGWCGWELDHVPHTAWNRYAPGYYARSVLA